MHSSFWRHADRRLTVERQKLQRDTSIKHLTRPITTREYCLTHSDSLFLDSRRCDPACITFSPSAVRRCIWTQSSYARLREGAKGVNTCYTCIAADMSFNLFLSALQGTYIVRHLGNVFGFLVCEFVILGQSPILSL